MIVSNKVTILGKSLLSSTALVAGFLVVSVTSSAHAADPVVDGTFVGGNSAGTFTNTNNLTTITVHQDNTIANFDQYNIGANQGVHYQHDLGINGNVNHLSRVTGGNESRILGKLTSDNVNVFLVNPNGIFFGKNATVNVPNLIASTADISDANFKAGNYKFDKAGNADAKIVNNGTITIKDGGLAALVAPGVENNGVIVANQGSVHLASGEEFTVDMYGDKLINFAITKAAKNGYVKQTGKITALDGIVALTTQDANDVVNGVINMDGVIEANTVTIEGGNIVLGATSEIVANDGKGNGGTVIAKATKSLKADGKIDASATGAGKGGFVETSAEEVNLGETLSVDTSADNGQTGEWLIDPSNFTITSGFGGFNSINNVLLSTLLINNNITLQTSALGAQDGDINVNANVTKVAGGTTTLSLVAHDDINIATGVTISSGLFADGLNVNLAAQDEINVDGTIFTNGGNFSAGKNFVGGAVTGRSNTFTNDGTINAGAGNVTVRADEINVNNEITANAIALNTGVAGHINLDAHLNSNNLSSNTKEVNVISNNAIINQGVQLVNAGGVVNVGAGTYDQSVLVNKDITLAGDAAGGTIIAPTTANLNDEFRSSYNWNEKNKAIVLVQNANADIKDITVDGTNAATGYQNTFTQFERLVGVAYDNASGTVDNVDVKNIADDGRNFSTGIFADSNTTKNDKSANPFSTGVNVLSGDADNVVTVRNSTVDGYEYKGISANGNKLTAIIDSNTVTSAKAKAGVEFTRGTKGTITRNTIVNDSNEFSIFGGNSSDILLDRAGSGVVVDDNTIVAGNGKGIGIQVLETDNATLSNNDIQGEQTGVVLASANGTTLDTNNIENNNDGVVALLSTGGVLKNNTITNNTNAGVALLFSDASLTGDVITGGATGLQVFGPTASTSFGAGVKFVGQTGQYISLEGLAMNDQNLDATDVEFDGIKGGVATDDQLVAIEDKIHHELDDSNVGLVYFKANTVVATKNNNGIQAGVNSADAGNTVLIGAGEYDESVIIKDKDLTLDGANDGAGVIVKPLSQASLDNEFRSSYNWNEENKSILLVQNANVTIQDLTVDGSGVPGGYKNIIGGNFERLVGIGFDNAGGTVANVAVKNIADDSKGFSAGIFADSNATFDNKSTNQFAGGTTDASGDTARTVDVSNSIVEGYEYKGISANGDLLTANVDTNTVTSNTGKAGIDFTRGVTGQIKNNTIDNSSALTGTFGGSSDILLDRAGSGILVDNNTIIAGNGLGIGIQLLETNGATVSNNDIQGEQTGIFLASANGNTIGTNNIEDNTDGVVALLSSGNTFEDNTITDNSNTGVALLFSDNNNFNRDVITDNGTGVYIYGSDLNTVDLATIDRNGVGVNILGGSNNTSITNTVINDGDIGLLVDGNNAPITLTLDNVVFGGAQTDAAIRFQNATLVDGVSVNDVKLLSTAPLGWEFVNVTGGPVTDVLDTGDMNFGNTVFGDTYSVQDIQLTNSLMDGDATNATFVNDLNDPFAREDRVYHTLDVPAEGTIFYNGFNLVAANFGNLFGNIARRVDLREVYYNPVSTAGVAYDNPSISGVAKATTFNSTNDFRVSLNGGVAGSPSNAAGQSVQYAANTVNAANANPADLNNLETAATGGAAGEDLQDLETAAGGNAQSCEVNFANDFLGEDVLLANASGTCSTGNAAQVQ